MNKPKCKCAVVNDNLSFNCGSHHFILLFATTKKSLYLVNVHQLINMLKETVYHGRQDDVQSVHSLYEVTERDIKLNPGWKVLVGGLCILAMLLECTNVVLSSRMENKDHKIDYALIRDKC